MKIFGLIPARSGSKRIPGKNIKVCAGKPLISWTIEAALLSKLDNLYVSTDCPEILSICNEYKHINTITRPNELASDEVPMMPVISHFLEIMSKNSEKVDAVMLLQPTSPLRNHKHINKAIELFKSEEIDSLVSVVEAPHAFHPNKILTIKNSELTPYLNVNETNEKWPVAVGRNGPAILLSKKKVFKQGKLYGEHIYPYMMEKEDSIDIDEDMDFKFAEFLLKSKVEKKFC